MDLLEYSHNIKSQNGEDGIILKILDILNDDKKPINNFFVEFGAWDGEYLSNTYNLMQSKNWGGVYIEGDTKKASQLKEKYKDNNNITCINSFVDSEKEENSLSTILQKSNTPKDFGILSIDIDGNDYEVWRDLENFYPALVIIEYNQTIPPNIEFIDTRGTFFYG